jgi:hypothetical protein
VTRETAWKPNPSFPASGTTHDGKTELEIAAMEAGEISAADTVRNISWMLNARREETGPSGRSMATVRLDCKPTL